MIDLCGAITFSRSNDYLIDNPFKKISYYKTLNYKNSIIKGNNFLIYLLNATRKEYYDNKNLLIIIFGEVFHNNKSNKKGNTILDAEDVYQKYLLNGLNFYKYIKGSFTIVVYDKNKNTSYLISDRYNIIPLFYFYYKQTLYFSSSLKALIKQNKINVKINYQAITEIMLFHVPLGNKSLYENILMQNPASIVKADYTGIQEHIYWHFYDFIVNEFKYQYKEYLERGSEIFYDSVNKYSDTKDEIVVPLSSGYDTRTILSVLNRAPKDIQCFSFGLDGCDDITIPLKIKEKLKINYSPIYLDTKKFENKFNEMAYNAIYFSDGIGNLSRANNVFGYYFYSQYANKDISGVFGSEILKKVSNTVAISQLIKDYFLNQPSQNNFKHKIYQYCNQHSINYNFIENYLDNIYNELNISYFEKFKNRFTNQYIHYIFLYEEGFRKYFMQDIRTSRYYIDVKLPFIDSDFIEFIFNSPFAGIYRSANEIKNIKYRYNKHLFYSYIIQKYYPALANFPTSHYHMKPKNQKNIATLCMELPKYFYYKYHKNNNKLYNYDKWGQQFLSNKHIYRESEINNVLNLKHDIVSNFGNVSNKRELFKYISLSIYLSNY